MSLAKNKAESFRKAIKTEYKGYVTYYVFLYLQLEQPRLLLLAVII